MAVSALQADYDNIVRTLGAAFANKIYGAGSNIVRAGAAPAATNAQINATGGGLPALQQSATAGGQVRPTAPAANVGRWIIQGTAGGNYHLPPGILEKAQAYSKAHGIYATENDAVFVNDATGEVSLNAPPAGQPWYNVDRNGNPVMAADGQGNVTQDWKNVLSANKARTSANFGFGEGLGGKIGLLAAGSAFLPALAGLAGGAPAAAPELAGAASDAGLATAANASAQGLSPTVQALLESGTQALPAAAAPAATLPAAAPAVTAPVAPPVTTPPGFQVPPGLTQAGQVASGASAVNSLLNNGSGVTDEQLLTGQAPEAGGNPAGQVTPGFSDQGAGPGGSGVPTGLPAVNAPGISPGNIGGPGDALNRIVNGTGTPGDYLTLGIPASGALASLLAGANASNASSRAAQAQLDAANAAIAEQRRQFDITQANNAPFLATGTAANARLSQLLGTAPGYTGTDAASLVKPFTSADLNADPVYNSGLQFGLDEGTKAINARAIGAGNYDSGGTLKALTRYANDYGSTKANDAFNRYQTTQGNIYNRLSGVSGTGQTAVGQVAQAGTNAANTVSGLLTDQGNARSAGIVGGANAFTNAAGNINSLANNFSSNATLQALLAQRQPTYFANG